MFGTIDLALPQVTDQQLVTAKDIQWQKTVVVVITVKEAAFLVSVYPVVGSVKIQNQLLRCLLKRSDELLDNYFMHLPGSFTVCPVLPAAQG